MLLQWPILYDVHPSWETRKTRTRIGRPRLGYQLGKLASWEYRLKKRGGNWEIQATEWISRVKISSQPAAVEEGERGVNGGDCTAGNFSAEEIAGHRSTASISLFVSLFCVSRESDPVGFLEIGKSCCNFHNVGFQCGCACILDVVLISMVSLCRFMICAKYTTRKWQVLVSKLPELHWLLLSSNVHVLIF